MIMTSINMASGIALLTDDELRTKLRSFNLPDGPITKTTRKLFETKLGRAMGLCVLNQEVTEVANTVIVFDENKPPLCINNSCAKESVNSTNQEISTFYGVCLHLNDREEKGSLEHTGGCGSVFTDKTEALNCLKLNSAARFRAFATREEAEAFASGELSTSSRLLSQELSPGWTEPSSEYKGPKRGEITRFRKLIESGDYDDLATIIYSNPKYLISSADTPVIVQEGCHYNSMHVAAKAGQKDICKLIIETLNDDEFWKLIYPTNEKDMNTSQLNNRRRAFVLDLYLNTPDKGSCETPLHFACKFGRADVVEYLLSCSGVERSVVNKDGRTAEQVICTRVANCDEDLRSRIQNMFDKQESVCVPILRSDDNCAAPKVGTPCSPNCYVKFEEAVDVRSPGTPTYNVRAYAGPMSPQEAEKFSFSLRSPRVTTPEKREKRAKLLNIKRSDGEKGLERVARKIAKSMNVLWREHWKFLDCFADLSTSDGLVKFEEYLKTKSKAQKSNIENTPVSIESPSFISPCGSSNDDVFERSDGTPRSRASLAYDINVTPCSRNKNSNIKNFRSRLKLQQSPDGGEYPEINKIDTGTESRNDKIKHDASVKTQAGMSIWQERETCEEICGNEQSPTSPDINDLSLDYGKRSLDVSDCSEISLSELTSEISMLSVGDAQNPSTETSCINEVSECSTINGQNNHEKRETPSTTSSDEVSLFIEGNQPSKVDLDVFRIIKRTDVDPVSYPYISCWLKMVRSFSKTNRLTWPSPGSPRYHKTRRGMLKTWSC